MRYLNDKKGLSDIVATVLIILLALAAVVIVWSFVSPSLRNSGTQIDVQTKCLSAEVKPTACSINTLDKTGNGTIQSIRGSPDKVKLIIITDNTKKTPGTAVIAPADQATVSTPTVSDVQPGANFTASAAAVFTIEGKDYVCPESPSVIPCTAA